MLLLVKAFLKAEILTELGENKDTHTGTPQGGILSPLLANIALSVLDEHLHGPGRPAGPWPPPARRRPFSAAALGRIERDGLTTEAHSPHGMRPVET